VNLASTNDQPRRHHVQKDDNAALHDVPLKGEGCLALKQRSDLAEDVSGAPLDTAPACDGVATSSSPFQSHSQGDEDIAALNPFQRSVKMRPRVGQAIRSTVWLAVRS